MGNLIDGRSIAEKVYVDLRREIADLKSNGVTPGIAVVLVGDNSASRTYVRSKDKMSRELGLHSVKLELPASTTQSDLFNRVEELNRDPRSMEFLCNRRRRNRSMKPRSCARSIRAKTWTVFIHSIWPSWRWAIRLALCRARRLACNAS